MKSVEVVTWHRKSAQRPKAHEVRTAHAGNQLPMPYQNNNVDAMNAFKMCVSSPLACFIPLMLLAGPIDAADTKGRPSRGAKIYAACIECHGESAEGSRRKGAPRLTGQHDWHLFNQQRDFRLDWRGADSKNPHVKLMRNRPDPDDDTLHDLTACLMSLNPPTPAPPDRRSPMQSNRQRDAKSLDFVEA